MKNPFRRRRPPPPMTRENALLSIRRDFGPVDYLTDGQLECAVLSAAGLREPLRAPERAPMRGYDEGEWQIQLGTQVRDVFGAPARVRDMRFYRRPDQGNFELLLEVEFENGIRHWDVYYHFLPDDADASNFIKPWKGGRRMTHWHLGGDSCVAHAALDSVIEMTARALELYWGDERDLWWAWFEWIDGD